MSNREFLLKAHTQKIINGIPKYNILGWYASEKLDGVRCWYDGGISRGLLKSQIPWANNKDKDSRFVTPPVASGLWSSYGNVIYAPDWFLDQLPKISLDGELFVGRRMFQTTTSIVSKLEPNDLDWKQVKFHIFDSPPYPSVFAYGKINNVHFQKEMDLNESMNFVRSKIPNYKAQFYDFETAYSILNSLQLSDSLRVIKQIKVESTEHMEELIKFISDSDGEGIIFRKPNSYWEPKRSHTIIKQKPFLDAEGIVVNYTWGRETDKGSKLLGKMGNLILNYQGKRLELSGFTDEEREMTFMPRPGFDSLNLALAEREGEMFPGREISPDYYNPKFPRGTVVTFRYRELSDDGIPKESRFDRVRFGHA